MLTTEQVYIPLNKGKLAGLLRLSTGFTVIGLWLASHAITDHSLVITILAALGILYVIFFTPLTLFLIQKWRDRKAGIAIDKSGITDNTILLSVGYIPWSDIKEIKRAPVRYGKLLIIIVNNPSDYISRQRNFIKRKFMKMMMNTYSSPIVFPSNELKYEFDQLENFLQTKLNESKF